MLVCVFSHNFAHETAGAARTRHSLLPLFGGTDRSQQSSGKSCREKANARVATSHRSSPGLTGRPSTPRPLDSIVAVSGILGGFNRSSQHPLYGSLVGIRRGVPPVFSSQGLSGAWC